MFVSVCGIFWLLTLESVWLCHLTHLLVSARLKAEIRDPPSAGFCRSLIGVPAGISFQRIFLVCVYLRTVSTVLQGIAAATACCCVLRRRSASTYYCAAARRTYYRRVGLLWCCLLSLYFFGRDIIPPVVRTNSRNMGARQPALLCTLVLVLSFIYAERFHRHYSGQPALLNRRYGGTSTVVVYSARCMFH